VDSEAQSLISIRPAEPADAASIGAVLDVAVREGWTYLGALAAEPMFSQQEWDQLVIDHRPTSRWSPSTPAERWWGSSGSSQRR
jgi:hypothetical protein